MKRATLRVVLILASLACVLVTKGRGAAASEGRELRPDLEMIAAGRGPEWQGRPGPIRLEFVLPAETEGHPQPLLAMGEAAQGMLLFVVRTGGELQFGYHEAGDEIVMSSPLPVEPSGRQVVDVFWGPLMPPLDSPVYEAHPYLKRTADLLYVRLNDAPAFRILNLPPPAGPAPVVGVNAIGSPAARAYFAGVFGPGGPADLERLSGKDRAFLTMPVTLDPEWDGFSGPLRLRVVLPQDSTGRSEPLLVTGVPGAADFFFIQYLDERTIRLGFDHWGLGGPLSEPISIEPGRVQEIVVHFGSLLPPPDHPAASTLPELTFLRSWLYAEINGRVIFNQAHPAHVVTAETISIGYNRVGGSSCGVGFRGRVEGAEVVSPANVLARTAYESLAAADGPPVVPQRPDWEGYPGPVRLRAVFPPIERRETVVGEPLVTTGREGAGDFVFLQHQADGTTRLGFDHWGATMVWSEPFRLESREHEFTISHGALYPPATSPLYEQEPSLRARLERLTVTLDGRTILDTVIRPYPCTPQQIHLGANPIGGSTTRARLRAQLAAVELADLVQLPALSGE